MNNNEHNNSLFSTIEDESSPFTYSDYPSQNNMLYQPEHQYRDDAGQTSATAHNQSGMDRLMDQVFEMYVQTYASSDSDILDNQFSTAVNPPHPHHAADQIDNPVSSMINDTESSYVTDVHSLSDNPFSAAVNPPHPHHAADQIDNPVSSMINDTESSYVTDVHSLSDNPFSAAVNPPYSHHAAEQIGNPVASMINDTASDHANDAYSLSDNSFSSAVIPPKADAQIDDPEAMSISPHAKSDITKTGVDSLIDPDDTAQNFAEMISPLRTDIYEESVLNSQAVTRTGLKHIAYRAAMQGGHYTDDFSSRAGGQGRRAAIVGASMTYGAAKKTTKALYRQGKYGVLSYKDLSDGLIENKKAAVLKNGKFALKQCKGLLGDAGSRLMHEGMLLAKDFEGSEDLGIQAMIQTKNTVRAVSGAKRLFGETKQKHSVWQVLRQAPSTISNTVTTVGHTASKVASGMASAVHSFGLISAVALVLAIIFVVLPTAYALTGAASIAADDETITQVYTYITELDAKLSQKINNYTGTADVVDFYLNGSQTVDDIEITTNPDPILNYLDCVYGEYEFNDVKSEIDDIYSNIYQLEIETYDQDVGSTSESETVVDPDADTGSTDLILTYTPTYGGIVSKKQGSTLTTAILNNSTCIGTFKITFYCGCEICSEQWGTQTATGVTATEGRTIAVDPSVIPYGTKVHIDGFGDFIAEDCGGAIKGNRIDIFVSDHERANSLGVQYAAVYVMDDSVIGGIYLPGISKTKVSHIDVNVTSQSAITYLQNLMDDNQKDKSNLMNQLGQYTTRMNYGSPLENDSWFVSRRYGYRYSSGSILEHFGIDIATNAGQNVLAVCSGTVTETGSDDEHGTYLVIKNGKNQFLYGNLGTIYSAKGSTVEKGDIIAKTGSAASNCESSTLHIEYEKDGTSLNPSFYLYNATTGGATSVGNSDIVEVAQSQMGQTGGQPYWSWYGFSSRVSWCACFVSWCANQCGYIDAGIIPKFAACSEGVKWFQQHGQWQDRNYTPSPGDIIFFDYNHVGTSHHVGIVERVEGSTVYTIEGNSSDAVHERHYTIGESDICGYGIPQYGS